MRTLAVIACLFLLPASNAFAQFDWDRFFDHDGLFSDDFFDPPPLPPPTVIVEWPFDGCGLSGWGGIDLGGQPAYFHVDDFAGLSSPYVPIIGNRSLWCGIRPTTSDPGCSYASLPGYGNSWTQYWTTKNCLAVSGTVTITCAAQWDTEPSYDNVFVEFDHCDDNWLPATGTSVFSGLGSTGGAVATIPAGSHSGSVRVRYKFQSDAQWSDEDGLWPTSGAIIIDNLGITDAGGTVLAVEDFEGELAGTLSSNDWIASSRPGLGDFAALLPGTAVLQEDPYYQNLSCLWTFFTGSTADYGCGGHAEQTAVEFMRADGAHMRNEIRSPFVFLLGPVGYQTTLVFDVYRDLPLDNLIVYQWAVRSKLLGESCPGPWMDNGFVYYNDRKRWNTVKHDMTPMLEAAVPSDQFQIALRVIDMAPVWAGSVGSGTCHSHAPLFDNIKVQREFGRSHVASLMSLFQDAFPANGTADGTVSVNGVASDYLAIQITDPGEPIDYHVPNDPATGPAVYLNVRNLPNKSGQIISGGQQYPVVATGQEWTTMQMTTGIKPHEYIADLNDDLYEPGDKIEYYVSSRGINNTWSYWSLATGATSEVIAQQYPMEMQCLPTPATPDNAPATPNTMPTAVEFLYVDGYSGLGAQPLIESSLSQLGVRWDRFDRNQPLTALNNSLGDMATYDQIAQYNCILWNTGDILNDPLTDADFELMVEYLTNNPNGRLFLTGDNIASAIATSNNPSAISLRNTWMNFVLQASDHHGILPAVSPSLTGVTGSPFAGMEAVAFVGDQGVSQFDVLSPDGAAFEGMYYAGIPGALAMLFQDTGGVRTALAGFSLHAVRDDQPASSPDRTSILNGVLAFFGKAGQPVGAPVAKVSFLAQNTPNPFNPTTTISYSLASAGRVTLRIYDVAGRLVRTLVDDDHAPAGSREATWDGRDNSGATVASGVYFYRLEAGSFVSTKKMLLLK